MEEKSIRNLYGTPKDNRVNSLPVGANFPYFTGIDKSKIIKKGKLEKYSVKLFSSWKTKFIVLTENTLKCYENAENENKVTPISLNNKCVSEINVSEVSSGSQNKYLFKIYIPADIENSGQYDKQSTTSSSKSSSSSSKQSPSSSSKSSSSSSSSKSSEDIFAAKSEEERKDWVRCLKKAMYAKEGGAIFGSSLEETMMYQRKKQQHNNYVSRISNIINTANDNNTTTTNNSVVINPTLTNIIKDNSLVPEIVSMCVDFIIKYGLDVDGIFRHTGKTSSVKILQEQFDRGQRPFLEAVAIGNSDNNNNFNIINNLSNSDKTTNSNRNKGNNNSNGNPTSPTSPITSPAIMTPTSPTFAMTDIHTVASLLKSYLMDLPDSIIPPIYYEGVMTVVTREYNLDRVQSIWKISQVLQSIPFHSYNLLRYLCAFLRIIGDNQDKNRMSYLNLAKVFCNAILEPEVDDPALLMGTADNRATAVMIMISNFNEIFKLDKKDVEDKFRKPPQRQNNYPTLTSISSASSDEEAIRCAYSPVSPSSPLPSGLVPIDACPEADAKVSDIQRGSSVYIRNISRGTNYPVSKNETRVIRRMRFDGVNDDDDDVNHNDNNDGIKFNNNVIGHDDDATTNKDLIYKKDNNNNFNIFGIFQKFNSAKKAEKNCNETAPETTSDASADTNTTHITEITTERTSKTFATGSKSNNNENDNNDEDHDELLSEKVIIRKKNTESRNIRRSSSLKGLTTKDKEDLFEELLESNIKFTNKNIFVDSNDGNPVNGKCKTKDEESKEELIPTLIRVDPKQLGSDELIQYCCTLKECLVDVHESSKQKSKKIESLMEQVASGKLELKMAVRKVVDLQSLLERYTTIYGNLGN